MLWIRVEHSGGNSDCVMSPGWGVGGGELMVEACGGSTNGGGIL